MGHYVASLFLSRLQLVQLRRLWRWASWLPQRGKKIHVVGFGIVRLLIQAGRDGPPRRRPCRGFCVWPSCPLSAFGGRREYQCRDVPRETARRGDGPAKKGHLPGFFQDISVPFPYHFRTISVPFPYPTKNKAMQACRKTGIEGPRNTPETKIAL